MAQLGTIFDVKKISKKLLIETPFIHLWQDTQKIRLTLIEDLEKTGVAIKCRKSNHYLFTAGGKEYVGRTISIKFCTKGKKSAVFN